MNTSPTLFDLNQVRAKRGVREKTRAEILAMSWAEQLAWYYRTMIWRARRRRAMERDHEWCQGCLLVSADLVHHKTYEHVFDELMYELVSLCTSCHDRAHEEDVDAGRSWTKEEKQRRQKRLERVIDQELDFHEQHHNDNRSRPHERRASPL